MCAAREPRRFNGLCNTCCWLGHLSCDCLLQRDRIYSDVPTLCSPPISPPRYSGRSGGPGYDIPCSPPQYSGGHCYRAKPFVRRYSGGDGTACRRSSSQPHAPSLALSGTRGTTAATVKRRRSSQPHAPSLALSGTRYNGGHRTAPQHQLAPRPFSSYVRDQRYNGGHRTAPQQQPGPRPFCSFGWEQRGACRDGPPVNGLANSIAQGQAQRDVEMDCHGGPVSKVSGHPETTASLARRGPLYRHATSDGCNHLVGPSHRQPSLSRTRPLRSGFSRTIWRCRCSPSRRDRSSRRRRQ